MSRQSLKVIRYWIGFSVRLKLYSYGPVIYWPTCVEQSASLKTLEGGSMNTSFSPFGVVVSFMRFLRR